MKRDIIFAVVVLLFASAATGQSSFVKGYIVDNANNKTPCWIRNIGAAESAGNYEYRFEEKGDIFPVSLAKVQEFGIDNKLKCIRALIPVDVSDERILRLEEAEKEPEWDQGHAYLKVLFEGELACLYSYFSEGKELFYYRLREGAIQPLYYKEFRLELNPGIVEKTVKNNAYREQLKRDLPCPDTASMASMSYTRKALLGYFKNCHDYQQAAYVIPEYSLPQKGKFVLGFALSANKMEMSVQDQDAALLVTFSPENSIGFGLEAEYVFAFNNHKWSLFAEGNYYSYYSDYSDNSYNNNHSGYVVDYKTIEIPVGINYYAHLNQQHRIFIKAAVAPHFVLADSGIQFGADVGSECSSSTRSFVALGYSFKRLSCEARFYSTQNLTQNLYNRGSDYKQMSFRVSYALLK